MNTNPKSPISSKLLSECDDLEVNQWIDMRRYEETSGTVIALYMPTDYTNDANAAHSLMQSNVWPEYFALEYQYAHRTAFVTDMRTEDTDIVARAAAPSAAIARAWIVARENVE